MCNRFFKILKDPKHYIISKLKKLQNFLLYGGVSIGVIILIFILSYVLFGRNKCNNDITNELLNSSLNLLPLIQERQNKLSFSANEINEKKFKNNFDNTLLKQYLKNITYMKKMQHRSVPTDDNEFHENLKYILNCNDRDYKPERLLIGNFWILKNYIRADHGDIACHESITYTTHGDYTTLENLITLVTSWLAPISIAIHAPGTDFLPTLSSISYLRDCSKESRLIKRFVTFHIYFSTRHIPYKIPREAVAIEDSCEFEPPYKLYKRTSLYAFNNKILYPINVGRNIARNAALTHFVLSSDIQFYPSPNLVSNFLEFLERNSELLQKNSSRVFTLPVFSLNDRNLLNKVNSKQVLLSMIPEHINPFFTLLEPKIEEWMYAGGGDEFVIFDTVKRTGSFTNWEPIFIGTQIDPYFDERLRWEGGSDRNSQIYALCLLNYDFVILKNAFVIAVASESTKNAEYMDNNLESIAKQFIYSINSEMKFMYGKSEECD